MNSIERAVALSALDVPGAPGLMVCGCEDCACPVSAERFERELPEITDDELVRAGGVLELPLDRDHVALFSPHGSGGVVVVNHSGREIAALFDEPSSVGSVAANGFSGDEVTAVARRLLAGGVVHPAGRPGHPEFVPSTELTAWLHVTNKCNLKCPYCYVRKSDDAMSADVARDSVDALVESAARNGFRSLRLKYAGGEASLNAGVLTGLHDHAVARCAESALGLSAVLLSNGVALGDRLVAALLARDIRVMISLDGLGAAHDAQRPTLGGKPSSALVVRTIDRLLAAGLAPHISVTITSRNTEVADVVRFAIERELTFSLNFFRDNECAATFDDLQYEQQALVDGLGGAFAVIEELMPRWSVLGSVLDRGQLLAPRRRSCGVGDDYVVIDQNGGIAKCHMEIGTIVGHVRDDDPVSVVRNSPVGIQNLLVEEKTGCRDCTWRHWCSGGCAAATFRATGRFDVRSPNCGIYKAIYPEAVRLEGLRILRYADRAHLSSSP